MIQRGRLADRRGGPGRGEHIERLVALGGVEVEHILSAASDEPTHHLQAHDEWVVVLAGAATLDVDGERADLGPGDWALLPGGVPHTVVRTAARTEWLAVHLPPPPAGDD